MVAQGWSGVVKRAGEEGGFGNDGEALRPFLMAGALPTPGWSDAIRSDKRGGVR